MITIERFDEHGLLELRITGTLSKSDYDDHLLPAIDAALQHHDRLRILAVIEAGFQGFDLGAAWADMQMGLTHWRGFDRIAVVAGQGWVASAVRMMAPLMPCPVQAFLPDQEEVARRWLRESLGSVYMKVLDGGALMVQLMGTLDPDVIARAEEGLDAHIRAADEFRLLLDLSEFDGWQGLGALGAHFKLVREHAPLAKRVAVLGDQSWQQIAQRLAGSFLYADTRFFDAGSRAEAEAWLQT